MRKLFIYGLGLINLVAIVIIWWPNAGLNLIALGHLAGLLLEYGILAQLVLVGRIGFVEQAFGHDGLNRLHRNLGICLLVLLVAHPVLLMEGYGDWLLFTASVDIFRAFIALLIFFVAIGISFAIVRKRLRYETWYFTHLFIYVAVLLAFSHQTLATDLSAGKPLYYWLILNNVVFGLVLVYRFLRPLYNFYQHRFQIERVVPETHDVTSIYIGGREIDKFKFKPGQFVNVTFLRRGLWYTHPFSFSAAPNGKYLRLSIKASGDFTSQIRNFKPGTKLILDGPLGIFTAQSATQNKFLLIAGGIGITPLRSLAEELKQEKRDFVLFFANKTEADVVFKQELEQLVPAGKWYNFFSQQNQYIDEEKITRLTPDFKEREVYLCGPPPMLRAVKQLLLKLGLPPAQLHYEIFAY